MSSELVKAIETAKQTLAKLTLQLEDSHKSLGSLHKKYGFSTVEEFIKELRSTGETPRRGPKTSNAKAAAAPSGKKKKGTRTRITPEIKKAVKAAVKEGKTGAAIAEEIGISLPSVQNIKKELGLVRARK